MSRARSKIVIKPMFLNVYLIFWLWFEFGFPDFSRMHCSENRMAPTRPAFVVKQRMPQKQKAILWRMAFCLLLVGPHGLEPWTKGL